MNNILSRVLRRFTFANIIATMAVVLVVGGGAAYAAATIKSADIVNNQVYSDDVRNDTLPNGGLNAIDLAAGSVGTSEIQDSSIGSADLGTNSVGFDELNSGAVPQYVYTRQNASAIDTVVGKEIQVSCDPGDKVVGGGFIIAGPGGANVPTVAIQRNYAVDADTWLARAQATTGAPSWQMVTTVVCVA